MKIHVCGLSHVHDLVAAHGPARIVSLLAPGDPFPAVEGFGDDVHHRVAIDDIRYEDPDLTPPAEAHVAGLIAFLETWDPRTPLLSHCWAGISRSTATAFIAACLHNPEADEQAIADAIREASPTAYPNTRIVGFADDILGRGGRMVEAIDAMGRGEVAEIAEPFFIPSVHRAP